MFVKKKKKKKYIYIHENSYSRVYKLRILNDVNEHLKKIRELRTNDLLAKNPENITLEIEHKRFIFFYNKRHNEKSLKRETPPLYFVNRILNNN